jgi:hypothetical protein
MKGIRHTLDWYYRVAHRFPVLMLRIIGIISGLVPPTTADSVTVDYFAPGDEIHVPYGTATAWR